MLPDRIPPQNIDAEQAVLGSALISLTAARKVVAALSGDEFYVEAHRRIFAVLRDQVRKGTPPDVVSTPIALADRGQLDQVGGIPYVILLTDSVATAAHVTHYLDIVLRKARRRAFIDLCDAALAASWNADDDEQEAIEAELLRGVRGLNHDAGTPAGLSSLKDTVCREVLRIREGEALPVMETGLRLLDGVAGGLEPCEMGVICGVPGSGKSALAFQWLLHAAKVWGPAVLFSLEMPADSLGRRCLAGRTSHSYHDLRRGGRRQSSDLQPFHPWELQGLTDAWATLDAELPHDIWIDDSTSRLSRIISRAHEEVLGERGAKAVFVDYGQLVVDDTGRGKKSRADELETVARALKNEVAMALKVPVVVLVQPTGEAIRREDKPLAMGDVRGSSEWVNAPNQILLLNRNLRDPGTPELRHVRVTVGKSRNGVQGAEVDLIFAGANFRFAEKDDRHEPAPYRD